jgi:glucose-6-phosphate isomerase
MTNKATCWEKLENLAATDAPRIASLFADKTRVERMSYRVGSLFADFSKQRITPEINKAMLALAEERQVTEWRDRLFAGEKINTTEDRAVLHPALRGVGGDKAVRKQVADMRARTRAFADKIRSEKKFETIVHIGIGGSDLGPRLCADALDAHYRAEIDLRFAENVDGASINDALDGLNPETTLVVTVSKSFTTQETLMNAKAARKWLRAGVGDRAGSHMIAVSANREGAEHFGIVSDQIFDFWEWVGGRYSLWSAVGLSLQLAYGPGVFDALLAGAAEMDEHFRDESLENNLPIMMALTSVWNRNFLGYGSQAIIPYARRLRKLPAFLQQLEMESNGKSVQRHGQPAVPTCPIIWGDEGTNGQHAFFQLLHQGTTGAPVDFIAVLEDAEHRPDHHRALLANCFAQSEALMVGKPESVVRKELKAKDLSEAEIDDLAPQKTFPGNRPSTTLLLDKLDAHALGNLIALYEHKTFVASVIWNINAFDQWGVELGKVLAKTILPELGNDSDLDHHDASTANLIALARNRIKS